MTTSPSEADAAGPGTHAHPEDGVFCVIKGKMSLLVGERWVDASRLA